jgi:hypothetical protein
LFAQTALHIFHVLIYAKKENLEKMEKSNSYVDTEKVLYEETKKPNIFIRIRWYFRSLKNAFVESFEFFKLKRYFRGDNPMLIMVKIKNFDKPEMYISPRVVKLIKRFKLDPETLDNYGEDGKGTACIGFSPKYQKWYGWSHRAIYGFGIGDIVEEGHLTTTSGYIEEFELEHPDIAFKHVLPVGFEAKTLEDAKKMAIAFAAAVS